MANYGYQCYQSSYYPYNGGTVYGYSRGSLVYGTASGYFPSTDKLYMPHPQTTGVWIDTIRWYDGDNVGGGTTIYVRLNHPTFAISATTAPFTTMYINGVAFTWANTGTGNLQRITSADGAGLDGGGFNAGRYTQWKFRCDTNPFVTGAGTYNNVYFELATAPSGDTSTHTFNIETNTEPFVSLLVTPTAITAEPGDIISFSRNSGSEPLSISSFDSRIWETTATLSMSSGTSSASRILRYDPQVLPLTDTLSVQNTTTAQYKYPTVSIAYPFTNQVSSITGQLGPDVNPYPISTVFTSESATVAGLGTGGSATATVQTNGLTSIGLSVNGGSFVSSATVYNGDSIVVRGTTTSAYSTQGWLQLTLSADNAVADAVYITTEPDPATAFDDGTAISFGHSTGAIPMSELTGFFAGYPVIGVYDPPYNLGSFYRGGTHVPNMAINNAIPASGTISYSNFRNAGTVLYFVTRPGTKAINYNSISAGSVLTLAWYVFDSEWFGTADWEMGYGPYMKWACEYYWEPPVFSVTALNAGSCTVPTLTSTTPSLSGSGQGQQQGWKSASSLNQAGNVGFGLTCTCGQNTEAIFVGTTRMHVRHPQSTSSELTFDVPFRFNVYGP